MAERSGRKAVESLLYSTDRVRILDMVTKMGEMASQALGMAVRSLVDRDDDLKIGIRTSAITFGRWDIAAIAVCYLLYASIWWLVLWQEVVSRHSPQTALPARAVWLAGLVAVLAQAAWHIWLIRKRERAGCFAAFGRNHWIGFTAFITSAALTQWGTR